jgi:hypothetical protein
MPRFGTKSLLLVFAFVAVWLSTFTRYPGAEDVRKCLMLIILLSAMFAAMYFREKRRAFWTGFFVFMLISCLSHNVRQHFNYFPTFRWPGNLTHMIITRDDHNQHLYFAVYSTIQEGSNLLFALIVGCIAAYIYDQSLTSRTGHARSL